MSNIKVETARKLDLSSVVKSSVVYSPSKSCGIAQNRRIRSYSATLNRNITEDQGGKKPSSNAAASSLSTPKKIGQLNNYPNNPNYSSVSSSSSSSGVAKRRHGSFSAGGNGGAGGGTGSGAGSGFKRRKKEPGIVPPTKFLLGGNITDPLNLNSFVDETGRSPNQLTPSASPLPVPKNRSQVEVLIPPNINDPLNLNAGEEDAEFDLNLVSPKTKKRRRKNRNKKRNSEETVEEPPGFKETASAETGDEGDLEVERIDNKMDGTESSSLSKPSVPPNTLALNVLSQHKTKKTDDNKIVSPVIPQSGSRNKNRSGVHLKSTEMEPQPLDQIVSKPCRKRKHSEQNTGGGSGPKFRTKDAEFRYGNYRRYYGYRNPKSEDDHRLHCFKREWFEGKQVLDIGCNIGHITLSIARDFVPNRIVGLDIDKILIKIARRNVCHYLGETTTSNNDDRFPISFSICCGPIAAGAVATQRHNLRVFPNNICFVEGNYVLESDEMLEMQRPEFDTVICLSTTKWIHLNWGDEGLKRFFKRIFRQLHPGGRFILEAQSFTSYNKKKKLTEEIFYHYQRIQLRPEHFTEYLLSKEVGFIKSEVIDTPFNLSKGFRRPIQLFTKGGGVGRG